MSRLTPSERRRFLSLKSRPLDEFCQKYGLPEAHGTLIVDDPKPCEAKWRVVAINGKTVTAIMEA